MKSIPDGIHQRDVRCGCGNLLFKVAGDTLEVKCKRCRRLTLLQLSSLNLKGSGSP